LGTESVAVAECGVLGCLCLVVIFGQFLFVSRREKAF